MGRDKKNEKRVLSDIEAARLSGIAAGEHPPTSWDRLIGAWRGASQAERELLLNIAMGEAHEP